MPGSVVEVLFQIKVRALTWTEMEENPHWSTSTSAACYAGCISWCLASQTSPGEIIFTFDLFLPFLTSGSRVSGKVSLQQLSNRSLKKLTPFSYSTVTANDQP